MNKFMKRLSRSSFGRSASNLNQMIDISQPLDQKSSTDSVVSDEDILAMDESLPPQIPPPPPPRPPPRRRRKQTAVFYPMLPTSDDFIDKDIKPAKRPPVPPPIPPRTVSVTECPNKTDSLIDIDISEENISSSSKHQIFSNQELIDNLTQNLSVMEELNSSLRNRLKRCNEDNINLVNELAAIHIERNQLLQTCKELDRLKDNEWVCSICLDDRQLIVETDRQIVSTFCGHLFCVDCVNMALKVENVCPTCRKPLPHKKPSFHLLYF